MSHFVFDTDILSLYQQGNPTVLTQISTHQVKELATTIISVVPLDPNSNDGGKRVPHQLVPSVDYSLDRRAALVAVCVLQLAVLAVAPVVWRQHLRVPWTSNIAYFQFVGPWAMSLAIMLGFACAFYPTHWVRRLLVGFLACLWIWSALFCGHKLAGEGHLSEEIGSFWMLHLILIAGFAAALFTVLRRVLHLEFNDDASRVGPRSNLNQFHLRNMMEMVLLVCITLAACRLAGPITFPPWHFATVQFVLEMATVSLMGGCAILAPFSRRCAILFLFIFPSLVCFDVGIILLLQLPISQWTKYAPVFLQGVSTGYGILVANCILMMLLLRWLGYRLEVNICQVSPENGPR